MVSNSIVKQQMRVRIPVIKPRVRASIGGGIFRTSWLGGAITTLGRTTQPAGYSKYWQ